MCEWHDFAPSFLNCQIKTDPNSYRFLFLKMYETASTTITQASAAATADIIKESLMPPTASEFEKTPEKIVEDNQYLAAYNSAHTDNPLSILKTYNNYKI